MTSGTRKSHKFIRNIGFFSTTARTNPGSYSLRLNINQEQSSSFDLHSSYVPQAVSIRTSSRDLWPVLTSEVTSSLPLPVIKFGRQGTTITRRKRRTKVKHPTDILRLNRNNLGNPLHIQAIGVEKKILSVPSLQSNPATVCRNVTSEKTKK